MVELKDITVIYNKGESNEKIGLNNFSLKINDGDFITIIGSNGAGKTTLFKVLMGLVKPIRGKYYINNNDVTNATPFQLSKIISIVYQNPDMGVFPDLTIKENLILGSKKGMRFLKFGRLPSLELLKSLNMGLENRLNTKVKELSGGQKQALALILATISKPKLLLLDEHTAALDPKATEKIMELTLRINKEFNITTLMISHNTLVVSKFSEKIVRIENGCIAA
ncbi:ABC transporter ATP-binding protein [Marinitoga litoralis]|jgi:putative ABC transport system ATP-binding protein|uniref:ABC transporter ATP-binding protein n=1 Tax=Marinitoga litoralis TaxID=570855 RepID=UPI0019619500|nr:ATP-binding cassette domain-containing protein [Marinitoga litoralis]MBM7558892.1 putative ABC transport system ATP-binding protein [Marinitoga litoralis]